MKKKIKSKKNSKSIAKQKNINNSRSFKVKGDTTYLF